MIRTQSLRRMLAGTAMVAMAALSLAQVDPNRVVATVNGEEIKGGEYYRRMEWYRVDAQSPTAVFPVGFLTLKQLITERIVFQMAKEKGVMPSEPEIQDRLKETKPEVLETITKQGRTVDELLYQYKFELAQFKLRTFGITITDQEVENHYKTSPDEFKEPKKFKLRIIVVLTDDDKKAVDADLAAGKTFADVAKARSKDASSVIGGSFGELPATQFAPDTLKTLEATKVGAVTSWVEGGQGSTARVKFLVENVIPAKTLQLDAALKKQIRMRLMSDKGNVKNHVMEDLRDASLKGKIVINQPEFQRIYDDLLQSLRDSAKAKGN